MSPNDKKKPIINQLPADEEGGGEVGGFGGSSGEIEFRFKDPLSGPTRDDLLSPSEIKRLEIVHKEAHKELVSKQKTTRQQREAVKKGEYIAPKSVAEQLRQRGSGGSQNTSNLKEHPIAQKAQFSGDKQEVAVPSLNNSNTNEDARKANENTYQHQHRFTPKSSPPRPHGPGGM